MEYLVFKILAGALIASGVIWTLMSKNKKSSPDDVTNNYADPIELEDDNFAIPKPPDEFMEGVEYDEVRNEIKPKQDEATARIPDPKGEPIGLITWCIFIIIY